MYIESYIDFPFSLFIFFPLPFPFDLVYTCLFKITFNFHFPPAAVFVTLFLMQGGHLIPIANSMILFNDNEFLLLLLVVTLFLMQGGHLIPIANSMILFNDNAWPTLI